MIKQLLREIIGFLIRISNVPFITREIIYKNKATIVVYHSPKPEAFRKHIEYLSKHYNFISLNRLVDAIRDKDWSDIPVKSLVVTIDDGHKDNYKLLEIFKTYNINPTIYLCSHIVNTNRHFWFKTGHPRSKELKRLPHDLMVNSLRDEVGYKPEKEYQDRQALNVKEIFEMLPYVEFGSHTKFHPVLTACTDEKCREEVEESRKCLEELLNQAIEHFAYPNGDYTRREIEYIAYCGYKSARTLDCGWNDVNSDPYRLKVNEVQDHATLNILCAQVSGFFPYIRYLCKRIAKNIPWAFLGRN